VGNVLNMAFGDWSHSGAKTCELSRERKTVLDFPWWLCTRAVKPENTHQKNPRIQRLFRMILRQHLANTF